MTNLLPKEQITALQAFHAGEFEDVTIGQANALKGQGYVRFYLDGVQHGLKKDVRLVPVLTERGREAIEFASEAHRAFFERIYQRVVAEGMEPVDVVRPKAHGTPTDYAKDIAEDMHRIVGEISEGHAFHVEIVRSNVPGQNPAHKRTIVRAKIEHDDGFVTSIAVNADESEVLKHL